MWEKTVQLLEEMEKELAENPMEGTSPEDKVGKLEMGVWGRYVSYHPPLSLQIRYADRLAESHSTL
jgi:hypothetical protein